MKKIICLVTSMFLFCSISFANTFWDVEDHWASDCIEKSVKRGYLNGYPDGSFRPEDDITRIEFITVLNKIIQTYSLLYNVDFTKVYQYFDIKEADWAQNTYNQFMTRVNAYGSDSKTNYGQKELDKIFGIKLEPNKPITREEAVALINIFINPEKKVDLVNNFNDIGAATFPESIKVANKLGIVNGYEDGGFRPFARITRAEASKILYTLSEKAYYLADIRLPYSQEEIYVDYLEPIDVVKQILKYEDWREYYKAFSYYNPQEADILEYTYLVYSKNPFLHAFVDSFFLKVEDFELSENRISDNETIVLYKNPMNDYSYSKKLKKIDGKWYASFDVDITL